MPLRRLGLYRGRQACRWRRADRGAYDRVLKRYHDASQGGVDAHNPIAGPRNGRGDSSAKAFSNSTDHLGIFPPILLMI